MTDNRPALIACGNEDLTRAQNGLRDNCHKCGADIIYDPRAVEVVREKFPGIVIEKQCLGCAGHLMGTLTDEEITISRELARRELGAIVDLISNDRLREFFRRKTSQ